MSLIGPRPLLVKYLPYYNNEEKLRHNVRPGLSGLAQVNGRNAISWEEKFKFDVMYVNKVTFIGDVKIILETVKKAFIKSEGITLNALEDFDEYRKKSSKPKALIEVRGEILIERQISQLQDAGIKEIIIVTGYKAEQFEYLKEKYNVILVHNSEYLNIINNASLFRFQMTYSSSASFSVEEKR